MKKMVVCLAVFGALVACKNNSIELPEDYFSNLESWKQNRDVKLRSSHSFVNLAGLYWLEQGENTIGADSSNSLIFPPPGAGLMGVLELLDSTVTYIAQPGVDVLVDSSVVEEAVIYDPVKGISKVMNYGSLEWVIIERSGNYGIRLRDFEHPLTKEPLEIPYYEWSEEWYVTATYHPFDSPKKVLIDNIIGHQFEEEVTGALHFDHHGKTIRLLPLMDEDGIFIMFADGTSGIETYGSGRYLVADLPNEENEVVLDFNKAYNPPCAFTPFATCPLPPEANILDIEIRAGEKEYHAQH